MHVSLGRFQAHLTAATQTASLLRRGRNGDTVSRPPGTTLHCFSPPIMLATLIVESCLAIYGLWLFRMTTVTRLVVTCLIALGVFQLSEYHVCTGFGQHAEIWSRIGYVAITVLPAVGMHLLHVLAGRPSRRLVAGAYISMASFITYFLTYHSAFSGYQCTGNYVIFQIGVGPAIAYGLYYYGWLFSAIYLGSRWANQLIKGGAKSRSKLYAVRGLITGYLVFLIPTALANSVSPETRRGIPSIMCGFAVIFAFILTFYILPLAVKTRRTMFHKRFGI